MNNKEYLISLIEKTRLSYTIDIFKNVLNAIWDNVFKAPKIESYINNRIRTCPGIISSIDTLQGIIELCRIGDYVDVYLLIRKLRDNLFLDLFLFESQRLYEKISDNNFKNIDFSNHSEIIEALDDFISRCVDKETNAGELKAINNWKKEKLLMIEKNEDKNNYFQFHKYLKYLLNNNDDFKTCYSIFFKNQVTNMNLKLNDFTHSNSESMLNNHKNPETTFIDINKTLKELERLFLVCLFFVDSTLLVSDDCDECMELGISPPEGAQYWVNGYIHEVFIDIKIENEKLFSFLISHNNNCMQIDV